MKWEDIRKYKPSEFKRLTGVKLETFKVMVDVVEKRKSKSTHKIKGQKRGPKPKLCVEDEILMTLMYYREYRTFFHIAVAYGVSEVQCWRIVTQTEKHLLSDERFHLPGKKALLSDEEIEVVLIDASESPVERPKKKQKRYYSGKKKRHTQKTQIVVEKSSKRVLCVACTNGRTHDFKLFKNTLSKMHAAITMELDTGYLGAKEIHKNSKLPIKSSKNVH